MQGYIALHRKIINNEFYFSEKFTRAQAWIDLLLLASHKNRITHIKGTDISLQPGQLCWSMKQLADRWMWNRKTVSKVLKIFEKRGMLVIKSNNLTTVITITTWEKYQSSGQRKGLQKDSRTDTNNNVNNGKKPVNHSGDEKKSKKMRELSINENHWE